MPRRPLVLAVLTLALSILAACGDTSSPTQPTFLKPAAGSALDALTTCRGGWNSSTGRCE